ncbi:MAG TPA: alpha/beta fold hydrolase [Thermoanaerobaculia bacterium]|jgi:pimeloyl-ACP methyl ester carboxylesterase|nr:alpha/beta fold hydrolase [Thermoanaerobaculia bacterium]
MQTMDAALVIAPEKSTTGRLRPVPAPSWLRAGMRLASSLAPGIAARVAHRLFFTPRRARVRDSEREVLARGELFSLTVCGDRVVGHAWGQGPTVLLAHGWGGHSGQMTAFVDPLVAAGFRAVAIDLPGHGESAGRVSSLVHFAAALSRAAALFGPVLGLVAHSFGAAGSTYALSGGLVAERAVFFAPPAGFESFWARFRMGVGVSQEVLKRMLRDAEGWLNVRFDDITPAGLAPRMTTPLLVFHDPEDGEIPFEEGAALARRWPGAELRPAGGLGHLRILRDERCVAEAVRFLTRGA